MSTACPLLNISIVPVCRMVDAVVGWSWCWGSNLALSRAPRERVDPPRSAPHPSVRGERPQDAIGVVGVAVDTTPSHANSSRFPEHGLKRRHQRLPRNLVARDSGRIGSLLSKLLLSAASRISTILSLGVLPSGRGTSGSPSPSGSPRSSDGVSVHSGDGAPPRWSSWSARARPPGRGCRVVVEEQIRAGAHAVEGALRQLGGPWARCRSPAGQRCIRARGMWCGVRSGRWRPMRW
ncbi:hypothetical protein F4780DRAFT_61942 [Xylariomycetidae sp. FL0641]|nr:hypothetical protein F4780DRAFT_61942 [Xylariomycetidae sp. FL0641]